MGRLLRLGALAVVFGVVALAGASAAFAVEPTNPPTLDPNCNVAVQSSFCQRVFPICRPGPPACPKGPTVINNDQFDDDDSVILAKPTLLWLPATVTNSNPPDLQPVTGEPKHLYCYATEPGPDRPNVVRITSVIASVITPIGPSNRLCVPDAKLEL